MESYSANTIEAVGVTFEQSPLFNLLTFIVSALIILATYLIYLRLKHIISRIRSRLSH